MRQILTIGGKSLMDFHAWYDGSEWWRMPQKEIENLQIPGKNGDLTIDNHRFSNITIPFNCYIHKNFGQNFSNLINYLLSLKGYQRIESNEEPDVFRMGQIKAQIEPVMGQFNKRGQFTIEIDFMPQKWLKVGENRITVNGSETLVNPTAFDALPTLYVQGTGDITVNGNVMTLASNTGTTVIDCDAQNVYEGTIDRNNDITLTDNKFPSLVPGTNTIEYGTGITSLIVVPNWWKL
jgi:phage-related protein